jgi:YHS domain-containing protein
MRFLILSGWIAVFIFILLTVISSLFRKAPARRVPGRGSDMVLDEVCKVYIPKERAKSLQSGGETRYFCSDECRQKFLARTEAHGPL